MPLLASATQPGAGGRQRHSRGSSIPGCGVTADSCCPAVGGSWTAVSDWPHSRTPPSPLPGKHMLCSLTSVWLSMDFAKSTSTHTSLHSEPPSLPALLPPSVLSVSHTCLSLTPHTKNTHLVSHTNTKTDNRTGCLDPPGRCCTPAWEWPAGLCSSQVGVLTWFDLFDWV